jgi:hypothetical protein
MWERSRARSPPWGQSQWAQGHEYKGEVAGKVGKGEGTKVGEVEGGVGIRDGGISSEGRFDSGGCFIARKGGMWD